MVPKNFPVFWEELEQKPTKAAKVQFEVSAWSSVLNHFGKSFRTSLLGITKCVSHSLKWECETHMAIHPASSQIPARSPIHDDNDRACPCAAFSEGCFEVTDFSQSSTFPPSHASRPLCSKFLPPHQAESKWKHKGSEARERGGGLCLGNQSANSSQLLPKCSGHEAALVHGLGERLG